MAGYTVGALARWSCTSKKLPPVSKIKSIHIYDFDNTLFITPFANAKLWTPATLGLLHSEDYFAGGGWWHDNKILEATGEGVAKEEARAWEGWWNEDIVRLVRMSMDQDDALTVLLTGRGEMRFTDIVNRMINSKKLDFDMICLRPKSSPDGQKMASTMIYKQTIFEETLFTYREADDLRIYEDRPKHVTAFKECFEKLNRRIANADIPVRRDTINVEVITVAAETKTLDAVVETAEVQRMVNTHNAAIHNKENFAKPHRLQLKKTVFFTGYMINPADSEKLQDLIHLIPPTGPDMDLKYLSTNILITPRPATEAVLAKVGGLGAKQIWQVNGVGCFANAIWALRCTPIPPSANYYTESSGPIIVLAHRRHGSRPADATRITQWQPVPTAQQLVFETTVGEKVQLRVDREIDGEDEFESLFARERAPHFTTNKRKHDDMNDNRGRGGHNRGRGGTRGGPAGSNGRSFPPRDRRDGNSGGGRGGRGNDRWGGGRPKGRGAYRSLDDVGGGAHAGRAPQDHDSSGYNAGGGRPHGNDGAYDDLMY